MDPQDIAKLVEKYPSLKKIFETGVEVSYGLLNILGLFRSQSY